MNTLWNFWPGTTGLETGTYDHRYQHLLADDPNNPTDGGLAGFFINDSVNSTPQVGDLWLAGAFNTNVAFFDASFPSFGVWLNSSSIPIPPQTPTPLPPTAALFPVGIALIEWRRRKKISRLSKQT